LPESNNARNAVNSIDTKKNKDGFLKKGHRCKQTSLPSVKTTKSKIGYVEKEIENQTNCNASAEQMVSSCTATTNHISDQSTVLESFILRPNDENSSNTLFQYDILTEKLILLRTGIADIFNPSAKELINEHELSRDQAIDIGCKMANSDISGALYCWIASIKKPWKALETSKIKFISTFIDCSEGEFDKRVRRAQDQVDFFGHYRFIKTFDNAFMDELHRVSIKQHDSTSAKHTLLAVATRHLVDKNSEALTVNWVREKATKLFEPVEDNAAGETSEPDSADSNHESDSSETDTTQGGDNEEPNSSSEANSSSTKSSSESSSRTEVNETESSSVNHPKPQMEMPCGIDKSLVIETIEQHFVPYLNNTKNYEISADEIILILSKCIAYYFKKSTENLTREEE
jgi:hypothetical protein